MESEKKSVIKSTIIMFLILLLITLPNNLLVVNDYNKEKEEARIYYKEYIRREYDDDNPNIKVRYNWFHSCFYVEYKPTSGNSFDILRNY
ncbi:MAG: hypothetical protein ACI4DS_02040 [Eubacterium sp.]